jgi:hypothetical protein
MRVQSSLTADPDGHAWANRERTIKALQRALEAAGVEFLNGDQPGVRLSERAAARHLKPAS